MGRTAGSAARPRAGNAGWADRIVACIRVSLALRAASRNFIVFPVYRHYLNVPFASGGGSITTLPSRGGLILRCFVARGRGLVHGSPSLDVYRLASPAELKSAKRSTELLRVRPRRPRPAVFGGVSCSPVTFLLWGSVSHGSPPLDADQVTFPAQFKSAVRSRELLRILPRRPPDAARAPALHAHRRRGVSGRSVGGAPAVVSGPDGETVSRDRESQELLRAFEHGNSKEA